MRGLTTHRACAPVSAAAKTKHVRRAQALQCSAAQQSNAEYAVRRLTPPQEDLGSVSLPPNQQNGDSFDMNGASWVVSKTAVQFKLSRGKYRRETTRLYVVETSRWLLDGFLTSIYLKP